MKVGDYIISDGLKYGRTIFKPLDKTKHELVDMFYFVYRVIKIGSKKIYCERIDSSINSWSAGSKVRQKIFDKLVFDHDYFLGDNGFYIIDCDLFK